MLHANVVVLMGNLTKAPQLRYTPKEKAISDLIVAVNRKSGAADYIPVIVWGEDAESADRFLKRGSLVHVVGRLQTRNYERVFRHPITKEPIKWTGESQPPTGRDYRVAEDGSIYTKHVAVEVVAQEIEFLDKITMRAIAQQLTEEESARQPAQPTAEPGSDA